MTLFVVRHGRTEANASGKLLGRADVELDEVGVAQARAIGKVVPAGARLVSSPLARCRQTAEEIAAVDGRGPKAVSLDERLLELDYGDLDLTPLSEVAPEVWDRWRRDADYRPAGGETLNELHQRVTSCLDDLVEEAVSGNVVVVSHVSPIKSSIAWALGVDILISWRCFVAQAAVNRIGFGPAGPSLQLFNGVDHLV